MLGDAGWSEEEKGVLINVVYRGNEGSEWARGGRGGGSTDRPGSGGTDNMVDWEVCRNLSR